MPTSSPPSRCFAVLVLVALAGCPGDRRATPAPSPVAPVPDAPSASTRRLAVPGFGDVQLRVPPGPPTATFLVLEGSEAAIPDGALVARVPSRWTHEKHAAHCWYPAGELEMLAQAVEREARVAAYQRPILLGQGEGASVAWAAMAQAPAETFGGAILERFSPSRMPASPVCGRVGWKPARSLPPRPDLPTLAEGLPRVTVVGTTDAAWMTTMGAAARAASSVAEAVGAYVGGALAETASRAPAPAEVASTLDALGLPLTVEWPTDAHRVFVFVSGDGGWAELDRGVAAELVRHGIAVVGWSTLSYFWQEKTPEQFAGDLQRVIAALPADLPVSAGGYSFGAEVVPWAAATRADLHLDRLALIGPTPWATWVVSPLDWVRESDGSSPWSVPGALRKIALPTLCIEASDDKVGGCRDAGPTVTVSAAAGGHHFDGDYAGLGAKIAAFLEEGR